MKSFFAFLRVAIIVTSCFGMIFLYFSSAKPAVSHQDNETSSSALVSSYNPEPQKFQNISPERAVILRWAFKEFSACMEGLVYLDKLDVGGGALEPQVLQARAFDCRAKVVGLAKDMALPTEDKKIAWGVNNYLVEVSDYLIKTINAPKESPVQNVRTPGLDDKDWFKYPFFE